MLCPVGIHPLPGPQARQVLSLFCARFLLCKVHPAHGDAVLLVITAVTPPGALAETLPSASASLGALGDPQSVEAPGGQWAHQLARPLLQAGWCLAPCPWFSRAEPVMCRRFRTVFRQRGNGDTEGRGPRGKWRHSFTAGRTGADGGDFPEAQPEPPPRPLEENSSDLPQKHLASPPLLIAGTH